MSHDHKNNCTRDAECYNDGHPNLCGKAHDKQNQNEKLREALQEIAKPHYGLEFGDTDEEQIRYWASPRQRGPGLLQGRLWEMIDLEAIKARLASVGQTPWEKEVHTHTDLGESQPITYLREGCRVVAESVDDSLVDFFIHARQDMQNLITELEVLRHEQSAFQELQKPGKYSDIVSDGGMDPRG